jgi:hypothetical protein
MNTQGHTPGLYDREIEEWKSGMAYSYLKPRLRGGEYGLETHWGRDEVQHCPRISWHHTQTWGKEELKDHCRASDTVRNGTELVGSPTTVADE